MFSPSSPIEQRIKRLQTHLERENPILLDAVKSFRHLDHVAYRLGMLDAADSFATKVPWWPLVAILGTFSSGKSTFINGYLGERLQLTGNQAVDDKFTVMCFNSSDEPSRTLPGLALDADPRFPFYRISHDIESVAAGEGRRIDAYLQLKTSHSEALRGKILIDSPGFDADQQRTSTLRITDHIIGLADLVLVFFDARHPEPGAMKDTLEHLVSNTINRTDSTKFMYILNQIDNAAREDNPEEVFAAWQRALAQCGLTAGRFYSIYDEAAAIPIEDEKLRLRFQRKRAEDLAAISERLQQVETERVYRIVGVLEGTAKAIAERIVPAVREAKQRWKRRVLWTDGIGGAALLGAFAFWSLSAGHWEGLRYAPPWPGDSPNADIMIGAVALTVLAVLGYLHFAVRKLAARSIRAAILRDTELEEDKREWVARAFEHNTRAWRPLLATEPAGWGGGMRKRLQRVLTDADRFVQTLNNRFADPSGRQTPVDQDGSRPQPGPVEEVTAASADEAPAGAGAAMAEPEGMAAAGKH